MKQETGINLNRRAFLTASWNNKTGIGSACLNNAGVYCQSCKDACEENAIKFSHVVMGVQLPSINQEECTQCKKCITACPVNAITISKEELKYE